MFGIRLFLSFAAVWAVRSGKGIGLIPKVGVLDLSLQGHPGVPNTTLHWYRQTIDHFSWAPTPTGEKTYQQRYFVNDTYWKRKGPIFFYTGNEANVELYVNATGLMWENAREFGAALAFAEHRYYGQSKPFGDVMLQHLEYLTMEQALADYAVLIASLKEAWNSSESAVIAFGGSYGGMLAAWLRMKYPSAVDGAISASAPILAFQGLGSGFPDGEKYWQVVTRDATLAAGAAAGCSSNVRRAWPELFAMGQSGEGRRNLSTIFNLCGDTPLKTTNDVMNLALMHLNAWDTMAMGNYPYPSNYLVFQNTQNPFVMMPEFPVRAACDFMAGHFTGPTQLLAALRDASGVFYNVTKKEACYELPADPDFDGIWDYQWCTEMLPQETYFARGGQEDMFWKSAMNMTSIQQHCSSKFRVEPRTKWIAEEFGGTGGASNIVFSNGLYDPWSSGGVLTNVSETAVAVIIPDGAHHLDLFFRHPNDTAAVQQARLIEMAHIRKWVLDKSMPHVSVQANAQSMYV